jgi:hypothetical protein
VLDKCECYDFEQMKWYPMCPFPRVTIDMAAIAIAGYGILLFGGTENHADIMISTRISFISGVLL